MIHDGFVQLKRLVDEMEPEAQLMSDLLTAYIFVHRDFKPGEPQPIERIRAWAAAILQEFPLDHLTDRGRADAERAIRQLETNREEALAR